MYPFDLAVLTPPALVILAATMIISFYSTRDLAFSILASLAKAGLFLAYYAVFFDGTHTFLDDWSYLRGGLELYANGVSLTNLGGNWEFLLSMAGGQHFVYYLYNAYAFRLWGVGYYAPVAMNILLTLVIAAVGARLARNELGLSERSSRWFFGFLLLHPDILAWSNVMNGKDILVLLLHVLLLTSASLFFRGRIVAFAAVALPVSAVLLFLRFYVVVLVALALAAGLLLSAHARRRLYLLGMTAGSLLLVSMSASRGMYAYAWNAIREAFVNPVYGFTRFLLTPIPFHAEPAYRFLDPSAALHWMLVPFVLLGILKIFRLRTPFSRFFLIYVLVFVALSAVYSELQGPRQRVQLDYALAVFQFVGITALLRSAARRRAGEYSRSSEALTGSNPVWGVSASLSASPPAERK